MLNQLKLSEQAGASLLENQVMNRLRRGVSRILDTAVCLESRLAGKWTVLVFNVEPLSLHLPSFFHLLYLKTTPTPVHTLSLDFLHTYAHTHRCLCHSNMHIQAHTVFSGGVLCLSWAKWRRTASVPIYHKDVASC